MTFTTYRKHYWPEYMSQCHFQTYRPIMQDRYVGDVGDFGKYGLLRALCGLKDSNEPPLSLGVVWYLTSPEDLGETDLNDGKHTSYLNRNGKNEREYRVCDGELYDKLALLVDRNKRSVSAIQMAGILPQDTTFADEVLTFKDFLGSNPKLKQARLFKRNAWLQSAYTKTAGKDIIFFDPDNGIASDNVNPCSMKGTKYVFLDELEAYLSRGQSLIIYHHTSRQDTVQEQANSWKVLLRKRYPQINTVWPLIYRRGSSRIFFIIPSPRHKDLLHRRLLSFSDSPWVRQGHFHPFLL